MAIDLLFILEVCLQCLGHSIFCLVCATSHSIYAFSVDSQIASRNLLVGVAATSQNTF